MIISWFFPDNYSHIIVPSLTHKFPVLIQQSFIYPKLFHHFRIVSNDFPMMLSMFSPDFLIISPWCPHDFFNFPTLFPAFSQDCPMIFPRMFPWFSCIFLGFSHDFPIFPSVSRIFPWFPRIFPIFPPQATPRPRLRRHLRRALAAPCAASDDVAWRFVMGRVPLGKPRRRAVEELMRRDGMGWILA